MKRQPIRLPILFFALALFLPAVRAGEEASGTGLDALRLRQTMIRTVVAKATPTTVAITSKKPGGTGSGVVISKDGLILTAAHVTEATGEELTIVFPDGTEVEGRSLGANRTLDAGMAKITSPGEWPFMEMADSDTVEMGSWCVSLGHPGGFMPDRRPPVRVGRIWHRDFDGALYSDCTLIGGDSGGPLFDLEGRVIGIHSSIGGSLATNRHVGTDSFRLHWDRMLEGETWGALHLNPEDAERAAMGVELDTTSTDGARVRAVRKKAPAAEAGIEEGDTIVQFAGESIDSSIRLLRQLAEMKSGDRASVSVRRGEEMLELEVTLTDNRSLSEPPPVEETEPVEDYPYLGVEVGAIEGGGSHGTKGARVTLVGENSPAAAGGLRQGDVILSVNETPVASPEEFVDRILERFAGDSITFLIHRDGKQISLKCTLDRQ